MQIIDRLAEAPPACVLLSALLYFLDFLCVYILLEALVKMHRSKTAVKKLMKQYTFTQKLRLIPFAENSLHAVRFCKMIVIFQRIRGICFGVFLLVALACAFAPLNRPLAWFTIGMFVCFDIPFHLVHCLLSKPLIGRFRQWRFEKYHNTPEHEKLF